MGINSRRIKERAMEICESDEYQEARDEAFDEELRDMFKHYFNEEEQKLIITYDDIQGFLDSFTFPSENVWCMEKACGEADDYGDMKMEEERDRKMGL